MGKFKEWRELDVSGYTEQKGKFTYLSWAWAIDQLLLHDEQATWQFRDPTVYADGSMMVWCDLTANGKTVTSFLPVLDYKNMPIKNPNAMAVNTAMQRCLAKAVALHGIGLYIYAGEDIPPGNPAEMLQKTFDEQGRTHALALFNKMSNAERDECSEVIKNIKKESNNGTED